MKFLFKKKIIPTLLVVSFIVPYTILFFSFSRNAKAVVPVLDSSNLVVNSKTAVATEALVKKEYFLDGPIGYAIAKITLHALTLSVVKWINSGFEGGPTFVTDLKGFLIGIADDQTANFIEGTALETLCSPWKLDIKIALSLPQGQFEEEARCTLSDIVDNMEDFIKGDFSQGGWAGWFELTTKSQNNPYGAYLMASSELGDRIEEAQQRELQLLDWGNGFFSYQECEEDRCEIVTPGKIIEDQLSNILGSGVRQLEIADEFDEVVAALVVELIKKVMGLGGLRGFDTNSYDL